MTEWFENGDFWDVMRPAMFDATRWERAAEEVDGVIELLGLEKGMRVLDLCSGPGRHALEFAKRGYEVTAVDLNRVYLEELASQNAAIETVHSDMREFRREEAFDAALNLFSSFGYFSDPGENLRVLENLRASLKQGGKAILDLHGKETLARKFRPRDWQHLDDGSILLQERTIHEGWGAISTTWTLLKGADRRGFTFHLRLYSGTELRRLLEKAGFSEVKLYGWFDGRPYDHDAKRLVAVAVA